MTSAPPIGSLVMVDLPGPDLDRDSARHLQRHGIRAVCLFRHNITGKAQLARLTRDLRSVMGEGALIGVDQEGGAVVRAPFLPIAPAAMSLGAADDEALARAVGAACARPLRALGVNWNFAPVLDLNSNPHNPVIAERSFGTDPARVAVLARAWLEGSLAEGVAACVKHFPGHGDTNVDSHLALPVVDKPRAELEANEFAPFRALAEVAPAMMTAHIVYGALDPQRPATLSRAALTDLLRTELGYQGVVITDSLIMKAIEDHVPRRASGALALAAGADMVMALGTHAAQGETIAGIEEALNRGELSEASLARSHARLADLARRFPSTAGEYAEASARADADLMRAAWARGVTVLGRPLPLAPGRSVRLVVRRGVPGDGIAESGPRGEDVVRALAGALNVEAVLYDDPDEVDWQALPHDGRVTLAASTSRHRLTPRQRASWRPDVHLALWNPFAALDLAAPAVITYGYHPAALQALTEVLTGQLPALGRFPVTLA